MISKHGQPIVQDFYNRGGGAGLGLQLTNQTLPFDSLRLSGDEQNAIIAFLHSLSESTAVPIALNGR